MSHQEHSKNHPSHHGHEKHESPPKQHRIWFVIAVILMLIGMAVYVSTLDDAVRPDGAVAPEVPAEAPAP